MVGNLMDITSALLITRLVSEGVGVAKEIAELANRVRAGETITQEEINLAREQVKQSVANWDAETQDKT